MEWKMVSKTQDNTYLIPERWLTLQYYEALNLLFRIENALRVFVYIILKNEFGDEWINCQIIADESSDGTIQSIAKRRRNQSETFGYLGYAIVCPIMHMTSGEMTRLITSDAYWNLFKRHFYGGKEIIKNKLEEIGTIRNSLAHFRPIRNNDVDVIKQNSRHVLVGVEELLSQAMIQQSVVPTNTNDPWYKDLRILGTDHCILTFYQSKDERWVRLSMKYACPVLRTYQQWKHRFSYQVLGLKSSAVLAEGQALCKDLTYITELVPYVRMPKDMTPPFVKILVMVFGRDMLAKKYPEIKVELESLLLTISQETELIQKDNLARGKIVHSVTTSATAEEKSGQITWDVKTRNLWTPVGENDPPEYWGRLMFFEGDDIVAGTEQYPWMPEPVSDLEVPF